LSKTTTRIRSIVHPFLPLRRSRGRRRTGCDDPRPFQQDPFADVRRYAAQLDALALGLSQKLHRVEVDEAHLLEVERDAIPRVGDLRLQRLHVLRGDPADEHENRRAVAPFEFDSQDHRGFGIATPMPAASR
jgi:hypothetical protein